MGKVVGPGSAITDVTGYVQRFPVPGQTVQGNRVQFGPGGKGSNQMTAAHRAGADVCLIARRGEDFPGQVLREHYQNEKMSQKYILATPDQSTGMALIEVEQQSGQNRIAVFLGANEVLSREDVRMAEEEFAGAGAVLVQFETGLEPILEAKELARTYGVPLIVNPAPCRDFPPEVFSGVDYVTPNETEAEQYTGVPVRTAEDFEVAARKFFALGVKNVILTLGSRGVFWHDGKKGTTLGALKVPVVDTTGAGDAFNGAFACALSEGLSPDVALKFANCAAALSVTKPGASLSMPYRNEIVAKLKAEYGIEIEK